MAEKTLTIIARSRAKAGREADLVAAQRQLVIDTLKEEGCLRYELNVAKDLVGESLIVESWASYDLWQAHIKGEAVAKYRAVAGELIESSVVTQWLPD